MDDPRWRIQIIVQSLFECLLALYPPRFRREFAAEIRVIVFSRISEANEQTGLNWLAAVFREISGLVISIFRERWHELRARREKAMILEDQLQKDAGTGGGRLPAPLPVGTPGALWISSWALLTTAAIPAALILMPLLTVMLMWMINLGVNAGFWPAFQPSTLESLGFLASFALVLAFAQWFMLRRYLSWAGLWFIATAAGVFLGGLVGGLILRRTSAQSWDPIWIMAAELLSLGLAIGLAQWLYLRHYLPNAFWIIIIDILAAGSILLAGRSFTSLAELTVVVFPGMISGLGLWLLLRQLRSTMPYRMQTEADRDKSRRLPRLAWFGIVAAALVPLFLACSWVYAASQLELAKNEGIYPTVEEAVIGRNSHGWGGANVVRIEDVRAGPNSRNAQPHVWFGTATVYMDQAPQGMDRDNYFAGSFYIRVREGWVYVPEGAFPEFIGWVMELYNMEGVH